MIQNSDRIYATRLMRMLLLPIVNQKAYSYGIIDKDGNFLRKPETEEEKESYTVLHQLAFKMRDAISREPIIANRIKQLAASMGLLRTRNIPQIYLEDVDYSILEDISKFSRLVIENSLCLPLEECLVEHAINVLTEEGEGGAPASVPTNSTANIDIKTPVIDKRKKKDVTS